MRNLILPFALLSSLSLSACQDHMSELAAPTPTYSQESDGYSGAVI